MRRPCCIGRSHESQAVGAFFRYQGAGLGGLPTQLDAFTSLLANSRTAFIWKLSCHWLKGLWQCHVAVLETPHAYKWPAFFKCISLREEIAILYKILLKYIFRYLIDNKSSLIAVMAGCHQATRHYLNLCWPTCTMPYGVATQI